MKATAKITVLMVVTILRAACALVASDPLVWDAGAKRPDNSSGVEKAHAIVEPTEPAAKYYVGEGIQHAGFRLFMNLQSCITPAQYMLEFRNGVYAYENRVVSEVVTPSWVAIFETHTLVEQRNGKNISIPYGIDKSGDQPILCLLLSGATAPGETRRFAWVPQQVTSPPVTDLRVAVDFTSITIENSHFRLTHPKRGAGGVPKNITFLPSGTVDNNLFFLDRIVRTEGEGRMVAYSVSDGYDAETYVAYQDPLRIVIETNTGYKKTKYAPAVPGNPRVRYRYTYTAFSPVVEVSARYQRSDDGPWSELHFMQLSSNARYYERFVTGDYGVTHPMQAAGVPSVAVVAQGWAVMEHGEDACGVGFDGAICWDNSEGNYYYYIRSGGNPWYGPETYCEGCLYFGKSAQPAWYSQWMGGGRRPGITFLRYGKPWLPLEHEPPAGTHEIENQALRVTFDSSEKGFDCVGIENLLCDGARFVGRWSEMPTAMPGLWSLTFKTPLDPKSGIQSTVELNNLSPASQRNAELTANGIVLQWKGMNLPDESGVIDVRAEVTLAPGAGASAWRIHVDNRSLQYGLWHSDYPILRGVVPPGIGTALLPGGNWGGTLIPKHRKAFEATYPSFLCPIQMFAFNLGDAGLYLAAHDGRACVKRLVVTPDQDVTFRVPAENAGVPGAAGAPDYPVVIAAYQGDWWQAARLYREWAVQQSWTSKGPKHLRTDYPQRLTDLGVWTIQAGDSAHVTNMMAKVAVLYPEIPVGLHWYTWHMIPFDHSYPNYFPARPGVAKAAQAMAAKGQTVMPYINARIWDRDTPEFAAALPATCKQPSGAHYVETYDSGRYFAPMCPHTGLWQRKIQNISHTLMNSYHMGGIYFDQVASGAPVECYDATHGHPIGGGSYWVDGYRTMMQPVKAEAASRGVMLTTEDCAEPYMDLFDGFLAWNPRYQEDVPLLPAIYSDYTTYFTSPQHRTDSLDAFCAAEARDFLWGCQLGWNDAWILEPAYRPKQQFEYALCRYRSAAKSFLVFGQLLDEIRPSNSIPKATHIWGRNKPHSATLPVVMGTLWRDAQGRLAALIVNASSQLQRFSFTPPAGQLSSSQSQWQIALLTLDGETPLSLYDGSEQITRDLLPREICVLIFSPAKIPLSSSGASDSQAKRKVWRLSARLSVTE